MIAVDCRCGFRWVFPAALLLLLCFNDSVYALDEAAAEKVETRRLERITVTGGKEAPYETTGSSYFLDEEELDRVLTGHDDIHRALRHVPGVNIQEEEGFGLRPNIGFRGVSVQRSSNITLMEDGVLIAPAPYSAPAAYYFPSPARMEGIEVLKGSGQIKYGPRTTGGSLNLLSTSIPSQLSLNANVRAGEYGSRSAHVNLGDSYRNFGWMLETFQGVSDGFKRLDGDRSADTGYDIEDYVAKFRLNSDAAAEFYQELELKVGWYDELSRETYLGLTDEDFSRDHRRRYAASQLDRLDVGHEMYNLTHYIELAGIDLTTTGYINYTDRNWHKLQSVAGAGLAPVLDAPHLFPDEMGWIRGEDSPDDALVIRANRRDYYSKGVQSALGYNFFLRGMEHNLEFGIRYHEDEEDRFQEEDRFRMDNGRMVMTTAGTPGSQDNRIGSAKAWAAYVQDRIVIDNLTLLPGLRYENIRFIRKDFGREDPARTGENLKETRNSLDVFIPGVGSSYAISEALSLFGGIHRGFAPPGPGSTTDVREERSVNYEIGARYNDGALRSELAFFYNDYSNLLGADTLAAGGFGTGDLFNAGKAKTYGIEASTVYDLIDVKDAGFKVPLRGTYTFTNAEFRGDFESDLFGSVRSGDLIPYIPQHQASAGIGWQYRKFGLFLDGNYVDAMPTVAGPMALGGTMRTDSYIVADLTAEYEVLKGTRVFATVQNLFDEDYIVARRPAGARGGLPRTFFAGLKIRL